MEVVLNGMMFGTSKLLSLVGEVESTQTTLLETIGDYFKTIGLIAGKASNFSQG